MNADRIRLLQTIVSDPRDRAARLAYADSLLDAGDPRGELITVEHQLETAPTPELWRRRRELIEAHAATWWPTLDYHRLRTRCGFVEGVVVASDQLPFVARLAKLEPITAVRIEDRGRIEARDWPTRVLDLAMPLDFGGVQALPIADRLEALELANYDHTTSWRWKTARCTLPRLRRLCLAGSRLGSVLRTFPHAGQLEELDLANTGDPIPFLPEDLSSLRLLRLSFCNLSEQSSETLVRRIATMPRLECLDIAGMTLYALEQLPERILRARYPDRLHVDFFHVAIDVLADGVEVDGEPRPMRCNERNLDGVRACISRGPTIIVTPTGGVLESRYATNERCLRVTVTIGDVVELVVDR